jgi:hypothetical protein
MPAGTIAVMSGDDRAARASVFAPHDATLAGLPGRAPQTMESFMRPHLKLQAPH